MHWGISDGIVSVTGMILGILAGCAFMATNETLGFANAWIIGAILCLLRIFAIRVTEWMQPVSSRQFREDEFYNELPERVSDAITLIGFGFAVDSNPWLGLAAALAAIFSAYIRSLGSNRSAWVRYTGFVPMRRVQRLSLLGTVSIVTSVDSQIRFHSLTLPQIALGLIVSGCLLAAFHQWLRLKGFMRSSPRYEGN